MSKSSIWAVVPAAGAGQRMLSQIPKQYLPLAGSTVLEITLNKLLALDAVSGLVVALQADDPYWPAMNIQTSKPVLTAPGGAERSDSVLNAIKILAQYDDFDVENDWVLVHDAARPCVTHADINLLIETVHANKPGRINGGLLAVPVRDTMKRQDSHGAVAQTEERTGLWHALTPQLFPCDNLLRALQKTIEDRVNITDESSAMEYLDFAPLLVQGRDDNIKITRPDDLRLAEMFLAESDDE